MTLKLDLYLQGQLINIQDIAATFSYLYIDLRHVYLCFTTFELDKDICLYVFQANEKVKYDQVFDSLQPVNNLLAGDKVKPVSEKQKY
jgi:hypothetical protein